MRNDSAGSGDNEGVEYVYILRSVVAPERFYVGRTANLRRRLAMHNAGLVKYMRSLVPWRVKTYVGFESVEQAIAFEKYLKSSAGRVFAKKRL